MRKRPASRRVPCALSKRPMRQDQLVTLRDQGILTAA
jgi:hypothetical protein